MEQSDKNLNEIEIRRILSEIIEKIEKTPNDMELGKSLRKKYWEELKEIKKNT